MSSSAGITNLISLGFRVFPVPALAHGNVSAWWTPSCFQYLGPSTGPYSSTVAFGRNAAPQPQSPVFTGTSTSVLSHNEKRMSCTATL